MPTPISMGQLFADSCKKNKKHTALISPSSDGLQIISFAQLQQEVLAWANYLNDQGIKPGDRVAAIASKSINHYHFFYSCWHLGAIPVPICESLGDPEMSFVIKDSEPSLILTDNHCMKKVKQNCGAVKVVDWNDLPLQLQENEEAPAIAKIAVDDIATLIYTSGSTGMPKGVMLTHRNLSINVWGALEVFHMGNKDRIMSLLPYWHSYALVCEVGCSIKAGCVCVIPKDIRDFKRNIKNYAPTVVIVVPRIVEGLKLAIDKRISESTPRIKKLINTAIYNASRIYTAGPRLDGGILRMITHHCFYDPLVFRKFRKAFGGKIRCIVSGGAPLDLELQIFFKYIGLPVYQGYGLTETSPVVSSNYFDRHRLGSCGPVMPWLLPKYGGDYTFKDENGNMGKDVRGQLLIKGQCVMKGYWRHTDASAKTMEDGWLNTGDVCYCDKDGYLFLQGRKGNMIVLIGGEKLHPESIEDAVKNSKLISEAMVIGEKCKNVYICANVTEEIRKKHNPQKLHDLIKADMLKYTKDLAAYQKPKEVLILPDFTIDDGTLTAIMKIRRYKIKQIYKKEIEDFLIQNGEEVATKRKLGIASSKVVESLEAGSVILGNGNALK
ncbi:MAG: AMP-binding protein [Lentisphaeria bacterium]